MLQSISWQTYFSSIIILACIYYILVWLFFFRNRLRTQSSYNTTFQATEQTGLPVSDHRQYMPADLSKKETEDFSAPGLQTFLDELEAFTSAAGHHCNKQDLLSSLKNLIRKNPLLIVQPDHSYIQMTIAARCKDNCSIELDQNEMKELWKVEVEG